MSRNDKRAAVGKTPRIRSKALNDLDRRLVTALRIDGRATNRALADELGVAQTTVAARIRRLGETATMKVIATTDVGASGYDLMILLGVSVARGALSQVGEQLAQIPEVIGVAVMLGRFDLGVTLIAQDKSHLLRLLQDEVGSVLGIENLESELVLEVTKQSVEIASLAAPIQSSDLPIVAANLDELDKNIIAELRIDGRLSNRAVARKLAVSEGTIRGRLRRLENDGVIRSAAVADPEAYGIRCAAFIYMWVEHGGARTVADALTLMPELHFVSITLGRFQIVAMALLPDRDSLAKLVTDRISLLPRVKRIETMEALSLVKYDYRWVRLA